MSRKKENSNMETRTTSELYSNSLPKRLPANGKVECWPADMAKIPPEKAGNLAIPFQSEFKIRPTPARCDASRRVFFFCCLSSFSSFRPRGRSTSLTTIVINFKVLPATRPLPGFWAVMVRRKRC